MGCCFGQDKKPANDEPLLEKDENKTGEELNAKGSDEAAAAPATTATPAKKGGKKEKETEDSPPPPLAGKEKTKEKAEKSAKGKSESPKKGAKAPQNDKAPAARGSRGGGDVKATASSASADSPAPGSPSSPNDSMKSMNKKAAPEVVAKNEIAPVDNGLKVKGRGGELPAAPSGTSNLTLHGKSSQVNTSGMSGTTSTRLKKNSDCIDSCRQEYDLGSGKVE